MKYPNFNEEKKLWRQGYKLIVGLDEAGRGPLAGPVVAAAIMIKPEHFLKQSARRSTEIFEKNFGIRDSKKLSVKQREKFYKILTSHENIKWGIGIVSEKAIDKINILEATKLAMFRAIKNLNIKPDYLLVDGNQALKFSEKFKMLGRALSVTECSGFKINSKIPQKSVIKGDEKVFSCSAAGIIAKVTRDRIMQKMHKKYPRYAFNFHKGYGTKLHIKNLQDFGPCKIHRKTFGPVLLLSKSRLSDSMESVLKS